MQEKGINTEAKANMKESIAEDPKAVVLSEEKEKFVKPSRRRLYVKFADSNGSISYDELHKTFSNYGVIEDINIPYSRRTAFVTMETKKGADEARRKAKRDNPEIQICDLAYPRKDRDDERRSYGRGNSHYNRYKNRTNSWKSRENDRYSSEDNRRNRNKSWKRRKRSGADFQAFNNGGKKHPIKSSESSTLSSQAPISSASSYPNSNQLGQQFAQMNLNQQFPVNYENTQNLLAMSQMEPMQQAMYNQYLLGLYGNMPMVNPNASMDAQTMPYDPTVDAQQFQQMYDAQNMFQFYQPPHSFVLPFPQYSENPYGLVQFQDPSLTDIAEQVEVQGGDNPGGA